MKLLDLKPILYSDKLEETIHFYTTILDFKCVARNNDWVWASLVRDGVEIMVAKPNAHVMFERPTFTGSFYVNVDNVNDIWTNLKQHTNIVYGIEDFEWGMREFAIYDNNGYIIQFGQNIKDIPV